MIYDLNKIGIPPKPPVPWASVLKLFLVLAVLCWMGERDLEHARENTALADVVMTQQAVIEGLECGAGLDMIMPIHLES